jgi:hypothetical protein
MKALKLVLVLMIISLQVNATGYSHNMLVAQKMLKTRKAVSRSQALPLQLTTQPTVVKAASSPVQETSDEEAALRPENTAASFSQQIARWVVRVVSMNGKVVCEKLVSLFSSTEEVEGGLPANAHFISLTENILSYLVSPLRAMR